MVGFFAALILAAMACKPAAAEELHHHRTLYHDLGKLLFAFVIFWGYIAFSQYLLIWYANLPEEAEWYAWRGSPARGFGSPWGCCSAIC